MSGFPILLGLPDFSHIVSIMPPGINRNVRITPAGDSMSEQISKGLTNLPQFPVGQNIGCAKPKVVALTVPMRPIPTPIRML
ncbi:hypothetical protein MASR2M74_15900 [Paracoccaceae bacterium]